MKFLIIILAIFLMQNSNAEDDSVLDLSTLNGSNGFVTYGINQFDSSGTVVNSAGDINADGIDDFIISATATNNFAGTVYVIFGRTDGYLGELQLADIDGSNGFIVNGLAQQDVLGSSVSGVGDINNDGIDDIAIGARSANNNSGVAYFIFGSNNPFSSSIDLMTLNGLNGFALNAVPLSGGNLGYSIASAGDFNNDGISDVAIGANRARVDNSSPAVGAVYVLFGKETFNSIMSTSELSGINGKVIYGAIELGGLGDSLTNAADINGDGQKDLIIGEFLRHEIDEYVYVIFADETGFVDEFHVSSLNGTNGFAIKGEAVDHFFGQSISSDFDINNDGFADIIIGAPRWTSASNTQKGLVYIFYGGSGDFSREFDITDLDGSNGFIINGDIDGVNDNAQLGFAVSSIGDFNSDNIDDVAFSALNSGDFFNGSVYILYGNTSGFNASFDVNSLNGVNGFSIYGINSGDKIGESLSCAGDINNDGVKDFLIGAPSESTNANSSGAVYTVFGKVQTFELLVSKIGNGTGVITADSGTINCGVDCSSEYTLNTVVTLTAIADTFMEFVGWDHVGCEPVVNTCIVTMDESKNITAEFVISEVDVFSNGFE